MSAFFVFIPAVNTSDSTPARRCSPWATGLLAGVLLQPTGAWAVTETYSGGGSTNGTGARTYDLIGAKSLISVGTQSSRNGEPVELHVAGGTYNATVGNSSLLPVYSNTYVGLADAWSTGILAASYGWNGFSTSTKPDPFPEAFYNGGNGGAVTLSVTDPASILLLDASSFPDALAASCPSGGCAVTVAGVMALSQGGRNSKWERTFDDYYSESGDGGAVSLTFQGQIEGRGSYATVSGTPIVGQEVGIMAISRGGVFDCTYHDCKENYDPGKVSQLPGRGGNVTVTLRAHPTSSEEINLSTGAAIGVLAVSANGAIVSDQDDAGFNVDASSVQAGKVNVTIGDAADANAFDIRVGSDGKTTFGVGLLAVSAGSEATVPLHYQQGNVSHLRPSDGSGFGGDVTVNNVHGVIRAIGDSALGIVALSLGGEASIGLRGITQPGDYNLVIRRG